LTFKAFFDQLTSEAFSQQI